MLTKEQIKRPSNESQSEIPSNHSNLLKAIRLLLTFYLDLANSLSLFNQVLSDKVERTA